MAELYVILIVKGARSFKQVPAKIREQVRELLVVAGLEHLIVE